MDEVSIRCKGQEMQPRTAWEEKIDMDKVSVGYKVQEMELRTRWE